MDVGRIEQIRAVAPLSSTANGDDVPPATAAEAPGRMEDDSYSAGAQQQDRGMEDEEGSEAAESTEDTRAGDATASSPDKQVDLFA